MFEEESCRFWRTSLPEQQGLLSFAWRRCFLSTVTAWSYTAVRNIKLSWKSIFPIKYAHIYTHTYVYAIWKVKANDICMLLKQPQGKIYSYLNTVLLCSDKLGVTRATAGNNLFMLPLELIHLPNVTGWCVVCNTCISKLARKSVISLP